VLARSPS
jgi:hypothetical protein